MHPRVAIAQKSPREKNRVFRGKDLSQQHASRFACHEPQQYDRLAQVAHQHGGLIIALDGPVPQGGEPQLWCIRDIVSGVTLCRHWLSQQDQTAFETFLTPLSRLEWPILAVLSNRQKGLVSAVEALLPNSRHQFCQAHYLRDSAEPLSEIDTALKDALRKAVRQRLGSLLRKVLPLPAVHTPPLTLTGPAAETRATATTAAPPAVSPRLPVPGGEVVVAHLLHHTRYLLTLKDRPAFHLIGVETYQRLQSVVHVSLDLLAERYDVRLACFYQGLQAALARHAELYQDVQQGLAWLRDIAYILEPSPLRSRPGAQVARQLRRYLDVLLRNSAGSTRLQGFLEHLDTVSVSYGAGLFHCYDVAGLPRTHHEVAGDWRDIAPQLLRLNGRANQTQQALHRLEVCALLSQLSPAARGSDAIGS